jgi:hypothetical protein
MVDLHFCLASRIWRFNKEEIFETAGSSGAFYYNNAQSDNEDLLSSCEFVELHVDGCSANMSLGTRFYIPASRFDVLNRSKGAFAVRMPKELASIREQSMIPIYMDGLPARKCRIVTTPPTT